MQSTLSKSIHPTQILRLSSLSSIIVAISCVRHSCRRLFSTSTLRRTYGGTMSTALEKPPGAELLGRTALDTPAIIPDSAFEGETIPTPTTPLSRKLSGYELYHQVLGSPKYVVAPMVDQSELAWRVLTRRYGAQLVYTPMINAKMFYLNQSKKGYRQKFFDIPNGEGGSPGPSPSVVDRPLIVQFCANDPEQLLDSAKAVEDHCDAIDLNLGCPQEIARSGHYGAFLMEDWDLIYRLVNTLHTNLKIPVTAKFRIYPTIAETVSYALMLERAGAQILTCHGRLRSQRGQNTGLADWAHIKAVKEAVKVPVFANGNILFWEDVEKCLQETGADAVMSAEGVLYNPALFAPALARSESTTERSPYTLDIKEGLHFPHADLALEYLRIVQGLKTTTSLSAVKGHLFKLLRPAISRETDLRDELSRVRGPRSVERYIEIVEEMKKRMDRDAKEAEGKSVEELITIEPATGLKILPHWLAQPYFRVASKSVQRTEEQVMSEASGIQLASKRTHIEDVEEDEDRVGEDTKRPKLTPIPL